MSRSQRRDSCHCQTGFGLGASRINPLKIRRGIEGCLDYFRHEKFDALISIGGEGTLQIASACSRKKMPVVCVPKTIDNDTWGTDFTIGFQTAVQVAAEAIDRLHTTAASHHEVMIKVDKLTLDLVRACRD